MLLSCKGNKQKLAQGTCVSGNKYDFYSDFYAGINSAFHKKNSETKKCRNRKRWGLSVPKILLFGNQLPLLLLQNAKLWERQADCC